jgi:hypothetical protein|nr:MAG TPA: hypothetical protein [Caudoviricetes sp.]
MVIRLDENYNAMTSTALLGYVGETNARPVSVEGMEIDGADRYVMTIDYGDGVQYEVDITGGQWTPTADILRSAQTVSCQIAAKKLSGDEYILVKKSRIFRLRIGTAIGDTAIPSPDVAMDALDRIDAIGRQAHADMQTAVTAAETATTAAENAEKSATDAEKSADTAEQAASRAETAAQTAQAVADSLPEDYTTAVGKIAENTADIASIKLNDKEMKRRVDALYDIGQGITHKFETDSDTAYAKTVPTGAKLMSVKSVGGRSIVWNQLVKPVPAVVTGAGVKATFSDDGIITLNGTATTTGSAVSVQPVKNQKGHKYLMIANPLSGVYGKDQLQFSSQSYGQDSTGHGTIITNESSNEKWYYTLYVYEGVTYDNVKLQPQIFDLTAMFGSGNEPSTVEEFEKMFPADYYPYAVGEIVSAGTEEVVVGDTAHPIPEAIRNLPGYGWSAGTAKNWVDYENKKYIQCVDSVDLGTLGWGINTTSAVGRHFYGYVRPLNFKYLGVFGTTVYNVLCSKYRTVPRSSNVFVDKTITIDGVDDIVSQVQIKDTAYTDATAFKQAMSGVILYYELANPIVTDISSLIPDDFLRNIEVEAGGSVTFKNSNDSYLIPVPSEEEYIVKLSEVGGTT